MRFICGLCKKEHNSLYELLEHSWYKHRWKDGRYYKYIQKLMIQIHSIEEPQYARRQTSRGNGTTW